MNIAVSILIPIAAISLVAASFNSRVETNAIPIFVNLQPQKDNADTIYWNQDRKLTWADFQGKAPETRWEKANTDAGISFATVQEGEIYKIKLLTMFAVKKSWTLTDDAYILSHEQGHFDITEIGRRKIRKALIENNCNEIPQDRMKKDIHKVEDIYRKGMDNMEKEQEKYDKETNHSIIVDQQKRWLEKIANDLKDLDKYAQID